MFYADLLLRKGGVILLDDVRHRGVKPVMAYVRSNYAHLRVIEDTLAADTLATFVKMGPDTRSWDFHREF